MREPTVVLPGNRRVLLEEMMESELARLERLMEQARQSARSADLARTRYREGLTDFLDLLDAERTQLGAEDAVARVEAGVFTSVVDVYKALGGPAVP